MSRREELIAAGLCPHCGIRPPARPGLINCQVYLDEMASDKYPSRTSAARVKGNKRRRQKPDVKVQMLNNGHRRRLKFKELFVEKVDKEELWWRDGGVCQLCNGVVDINMEWPGYYDPEYPTVDHIVPLELNGEHSYANTQIAHYECNSRKRHRLEAKFPSLWKKVAA